MTRKISIFMLIFLLGISAFFLLKQHYVNQEKLFKPLFAKDGLQLIYDVHMISNVDVNTAFLLSGFSKSQGKQQTVHYPTEVQGQVQISFLRKGHDGWLLQAVPIIHKFNYLGKDLLSEILSKQIDIYTNPMGIIERIDMSSDLDNRYQMLMYQLVGNLLYTIPISNTKEWNYKERDRLGIFQSQSQFDAETQIIQRKKISYIAYQPFITDQFPLFISKLSSEATYQLSEKNNMPDHIKSTEYYQLRTDKMHVSDNSIYFTALQVDKLSQVKVGKGKKIKKETKEKTAYVKNTDIFSKLDTPAKVNTFIEYLNQYHLDGFKSKEEEYAHADLWRELAEKGKPIIQMAMLAAAENTGLHYKTRMQAILHMDDIPNPIPELVYGLNSIYDSIPFDADSPDDMIRQMALLKVGSLGESSVAILSERLTSAESEMEIMDTLIAVGNGGQNALLEYVTPFFTNQNPTLRSAAFQSIRKMDSDDSTELFINSYENENSAEIRSSAVELIQEVSNERLIMWANEQVLNSTDINETLKLIKVLGDTMGQYNTNRETLYQLLETAVHPAIKYQIYKYIPPK